LAGETKALPDEKEDEEEEPIDPKAECPALPGPMWSRGRPRGTDPKPDPKRKRGRYLRQNQKQRKKKALGTPQGHSGPILYEKGIV